MNLHFVGICGTGAYRVAIAAKRMGYNVTGCDANLNKNYEVLKKEGIEVYCGHSVDHIVNIDIVIISPIFLHLKEKVDEVEKSISLGKCITWQNFLSQEIIKNNSVIAVSGTHGKTTICALLSELFIKSGILSYTISGESAFCNLPEHEECPLFIIEAEEYNENFLEYFPYILIINNVEMDHPNQFRNIKESRDLYTKFIAQINNNGYLIVNIDDENVKIILNNVKQQNIKVIGYTKNKKNQSFNLCNDLFVFEYIESEEEITIFNKNKQVIKFFNMLGGLHNAYNLVSVYIITVLFQIPSYGFVEFSKNTRNLQRRMERVNIVGNRLIYNDYAHHPSEMQCVLTTLLKRHKKELYVIWQPNQYDRTIYFYDRYIEVLSFAKNVILLDIESRGDDINVYFPYKKMVDELIRNGTDAKHLKEISDIYNIKELAYSDSVYIVFTTDYNNEIIKELVRYFEQ